MNQKTFAVPTAVQLVPVAAVILAISLLIPGIGALPARVHAEPNDNNSQVTVDLAWSELIASMDKMHMAMGAVERSGNSDVDFVRLMLPHHQGAINMAKTQLLYGRDPQMRRLAQEIITDQQLEIELMQRWLKQQRQLRQKKIKHPLQTPERNTKDENDPLVFVSLFSGAVRDGTTSALGKKGYCSLQSRPRLHGRSNIEHGFGD